jgi:selenium-binding protein 1
MPFRPDPTFYPSPRLAMEAPAEELAYVTLINPEGQGRPDGLGVVDVNPSSSSFGRLIDQVDFPNAGNELHHFGWNACSACLCPYAPHPHVERRYLVVPGTNSSRIHIVDTQPDPRRPKLVKVIEADEVAAKTGYGMPRPIPCTADPTASTSMHSGRRTAVDQAGSSHSTRRTSTFEASGSGSGGRST